jgi:hypothetical protein
MENAIFSAGIKLRDNLINLNLHPVNEKASHKSGFMAGYINLSGIILP